MRMLFEIDITHVLPAVRVPTLVLHRTQDCAAPVENGRFLAQQLPSAKYVELPGTDHLHYVGDADAILDEIREFLTGVRPAPDSDRVLATVLFTDICEHRRLHSGECEVLGDKVSGIAVHLGARVCEAAEPNEVLVSRTVKDLVAGTDLRFSNRGVHALKGFPDDWQLYAAEA